MAPRFARLIAPTDTAIPTWLAIGALIQLLGQRILPTKVALLFPVLYIVCRLIIIIRDSRSIYNTSFTSVRRGKWFVELPEADKALGREIPSDSIVCFVLGARFNHPMGKLAPGVTKIAGMMADMWDELEEDRATWGFMGRTGTMVEIADNEAITMTWLSYWTDVDRLQKFATSASHRLGHNTYRTGKYNHIGIMHETFKAPKGSWETIYLNMPPFGLGKSRLPVKLRKDSEKSGDLLREIVLPEQQTLRQRMRGKVSSLS